MPDLAPYLNYQLVIISDIMGFPDRQSIFNIVKNINPSIEVTHYDARILAEIDTQIKDKQLIHKAFLDGGLDSAVKSLVRFKNKAINIIAFSIGGTIAWKAALKGVNVNKLIAVSSTRLRYEKSKPDCHIQLTYGALDPYRPDDTWIKSMGLIPEVKSGKLHDFYLDPSFQENLINAYYLNSE